jgi:hypothetical protein
MFPYSRIFKQALDLTRTYKFLWIFGLFLTLGSTLFLREEGEVQSVPQTYLWLIIMAVLIFLVLYFRSKAGMIIGIKAVLDKQETSLSKSFQASRLFYIRIILISLVVELGVALFGLLIGVPIASMFEQGNPYPAIMFLVVGLAIFIPIAVTAALINVLSPMFVVIFDLTPKEAVKRSLDLISKYWFPLSSLALLLSLPHLAIMLISVPIVFLADLPYHMVGLVSAILGLLVLWLAHAIIAVFTQTIWVLVFLEYVKPQKFEETEPAIAPEIVS